MALPKRPTAKKKKRTSAATAATRTVARRKISRPATRRRRKKTLSEQFLSGSQGVAVKSVVMGVIGGVAGVFVSSMIGNNVSPGIKVVGGLAIGGLVAAGLKAPAFGAAFAAGAAVPAIMEMILFKTGVSEGDNEEENDFSDMPEVIFPETLDEPYLSSAYLSSSLDENYSDIYADFEIL
jgi:hypothetical protein